MLQPKALLCTAIIIIILVVPNVTGTTMRIYSSTAEISNHLVPRGSTVVLVCTETPTHQLVDYQWECPNPPCDGQYRKVYGNVLVVVATTATSGLYRCSPTHRRGTATRTLTVLGSLVEVIYNNGRLLLQNTLFTSPEQIPNGLTCTRRRSGSGPILRFRREGDNTTLGTRSSQSTIVQAVSLQPNGGYWCDAGEVKREFFIYFNNAILPTPQVSVGSTTTDQHLHLLLTTSPPYNSGRFILRYDCTLGEADIEVEYRSVDPGVNSNTVVTRSRSCFVVGEIFTVTVWFVNGENISTTPAVVDVNGVNIAVSIPINRATITTTTPTTLITNPASSSSSTTTTMNPATSTMSGTINAITSSTATTTAKTTTTNSPATSSSTTISDTLVLYIGSGAGCLLLVLVAVLAVIICCVVAVHRRGKRSRSTEHTPTLHYYSTPGHEQEEEPQVQITSATLEASKIKPASFLSGALYDEVEVKPVKSKPVTVPSEYQLVEGDKEDDREVHNTLTVPESFYAQPDTTAKSNKKGEKGTTADVEYPEVLYAEVDKPKKKKKGKEKKEEQPQGDLYAVVDKTTKKKGKEKKAKEKEQQADRDLYAEVDKKKKKGKMAKKDKESNSFREAVELDSPPPVPDRGLIYEPSADREASDEQQQQQQQQQQELEKKQQQVPEQQQQQEQLQQQKLEEGVENEGHQEQGNAEETIIQP